MGKIIGRLALALWAPCLFAQEIRWEVRAGADEEYLDARWTPDGSKVWCLLYREEKRENALRCLGVDGTPCGDPVEIPLSDNRFDISTDGASVLLSCASDGKEGNADLVLRRIDTGETRTLVSTPADDREGVLSPDGKRLAYVSGEHRSASLWVAGADGGSPREIAERSWYSSASWDPEGKRLCYVAEDDSGTARIHVREVDSGEDRTLSPDGMQAGSCSWSRDGKWIAFRGLADSLSHSFLMRPDGTGLIRTFADTRSQARYAWSPDSRSLACVTVMADGTSAITCYAVPEGPAANQETQDGKVDPAGCLYVVSLPFREDPAMKVPLVRLSPDGRTRERLAASAWCPVGVPGNRGTLYAALEVKPHMELRWARTDGTPDNVLRDLGTGRADGAWAFSVDGAWLAVASAGALLLGKGPDYALEAVAGTTGPEAEALAGAAEGGITWLPDGSGFLLGPRQAGGAAWRYVMEESRYETIEGEWSQVVPLPGGAVLATEGAGPTMEPKLSRIGVAGKPSKIAELGTTTPLILGVSPAGDRAFLSLLSPPAEPETTARNTGRLVSVDLATGEVKTLLHAAVMAGEISHDGKRLLLLEAYVHRRAGDRVPGAVTSFDIASGREVMIMDDYDVGAVGMAAMLGMPIRPFAWGR